MKIFLRLYPKPKSSSAALTELEKHMEWKGQLIQ